VKITDNKLGGCTAGYGPAQRSFPLVLCSSIDDDDMFDLSMKEAALTHYSPLAGKVADIVNVICRALLKNSTWYDAVQLIFSMPRLHPDIKNISLHYGRPPHPFVKTHIAYAPTVLNAAVHYVTNSKNSMGAIRTAVTNDQYYCAPIVGILAGVLGDISLDMYKDRIDDAQVTTIHDLSNKLSSQWPSKHDSVTN
jgi:hypothetical protein